MGQAKGPALGISYKQLYGDSPMEVTFTQATKAAAAGYGEASKTHTATFVIDAKAALRLVAMLAPLAGRVLDKEAA